LPWAASPSPPHDAALDQRIDRLEAAATGGRQQLEKRVTALEAKPAPPLPPDLGELRQQIARVGQRLDGIDQALRAQPTVDATDVALALALMQIRDAVELGRPFAASYDGFAALARTRPDIAAAAATLAAPAQSGVATRAVLARRLREMAGAI